MYNEERAGNFNYHGYIRPRQVLKFLKVEKNELYIIF